MAAVGLAGRRNRGSPQRAANKMSAEARRRPSDAGRSFLADLNQRIPLDPVPEGDLKSNEVGNILANIDADGSERCCRRRCGLLLRPASAPPRQLSGPAPSNNFRCRAPPHTGKAGRPQVGQGSGRLGTQDGMIDTILGASGRDHNESTRVRPCLSRARALRRASLNYAYCGDRPRARLFACALRRFIVTL